jgi:hypothetical protein
VALLQSLIDDRLSRLDEGQFNPNVSDVFDQVTLINDHWESWDVAKMHAELCHLAELVRRRQPEQQLLKEIRGLIKQKARHSAFEDRRVRFFDEHLTVEQAVRIANVIALVVCEYVTDVDAQHTLITDLTRVLKEAFTPGR